MKDFYSVGVRITAAAGAASLLLTLAGPALAQRGTPGATAVGRRMDTLNRQGEQYERDALGREGKGTAESKGDRRRAQDLAGQVRRDFEGLQAGYNKIVLAMASKERPDIETVLDSVAEVKKCASRLRDNLALPRPKGGEVRKAHDDKAQGEAGSTPAEESLRALRKHIYNFLTNPLFESPSALDVEQAGKASRDLDMILELSEAIRKGGGRPKEKHD